MRAGGRLQAAVEVLAEIIERHRPASAALADWGRAHRFAGSGDRAAIGTLVFDALRSRNSIAARMGEETPRALALGAAGSAFGISPDEIAELADGSQHAPAPLTDEERAGFERKVPENAALHVRADIPEWLSPAFEQAFGERAATEGRALALRAPVDLRVNTLKATREKVLKALQKFDAAVTPWSPHGVRIPAPSGPAKSPNVEADVAHGKGWFEVQDEGSQIAALMAGAGPRDQVLDLCAGAGGKTLALAAELRNTGQIYAYDASRAQLRPIFERLKRAGARNVQVMEAGDAAALDELADRFDVVFVDAPCTGSGTWRRRPDAKWRLKPAALEERIGEQRAALMQAASMVRPGGRLVYVTCSVLPAENGEQIGWFLRERPDFVTTSAATRFEAATGQACPPSALVAAVAAENGAEANAKGPPAVQLTPASHGTDGFFVCVLERREG